MSDADTTPQNRRWADLTAVISVEVRQALTPFTLRLDRVDNDLQHVKTTLYGNPSFELPGLVKQVKDIDGKLDLILDQRKQTLWLMRGVIFGLALNFLQVAGVLEKIVAVLT